MQEPSTEPAADEPKPAAEPQPATDPQPATEPVVERERVSEVYGDTWFTATGVAAPLRPPLTHDLDVDVCVIGGGLAGLTAAYEIARRGWSVAVLETRRIAWNASSRNTGFVTPGFAQDVTTLVERVGPDHARALWALSQEGVDVLRRVVREARMREVVQGEGWLRVSKTDRKDEVSAEADVLRGLGADIEMWPATLLRTKVKSPYYFQAIHYPTAFSINPYDYALGLARLAEDAGARIFEDTKAESIDPAGVRKRVVTSGGRVRAAHIVFAGNVHLGAMMPEISGTLIPMHTYVVVTKPLGESLATALEYPGAVSDTDFADHHYRIVGGDRLMFAGRVATREGNPHRHGRRLRADIRRRFPQLGPVEIDHAWSGTVGLTVHRMPQIGELSHGVWLASGFAGHGLNTTAMAANLIAGAIIEGDDRFRLFEPFELVWAGGRMGRFLAKPFYSAHRAYEQWASRRSRKKELWWIANEPRLKKEAEEAAERARIRAEEAEIAEKERIEREKIEAEQAELRRIERERIAAEKAEARRIRAEEKAAAKAEAARLKEEQRAAARVEKERIAAERAEAKRLAAERLAAERAEAERLATEQAEAARVEAEKRAAEQAEAEWQAAQRAEAARIEAERLVPEQTDAERLEAAYRNAERVAEHAARIAAEASGSGSAPAPDRTDIQAAVSEPNDEARLQQPEDARPQQRRGFWKRR